jgi:hypothetical protein
MAHNTKAILDKLARNLDQFGIVETRGAQNSVIVFNGGTNILTISYVAAQIQAPMGGVDDTLSPFLGIGTNNPGTILIKSSISTDSDVGDVIDGQVAAQVFAMVCGLANDIVLQNSSALQVAYIRGTVDLLSMGQ